MTTYLGHEKPSLGDLAHHGVKGQKWGVRRSDVAGFGGSDPGPPGVSKSTNREAKKDAEEHTRAKLFYGEGAGTRRKLIKAKVEAKSAKDPNYKKAFDHHVANTDLSKRAEQARHERKRKDAKQQTGKFIRGTRHILNGNSQYASATVALVVGGALWAKKNGIDKIIVSNAKKAYNNISANDVKRGAQWMRDNGFNA